MIDAHRGAFEYDWRTRFGKPLRSVGRSISWGEALRLTSILSGDPSSCVAAAMAEWDRPMDRASIVLMNLFDLTHNVAWAQGGGKGSRPKPHPRPWRDRTRRVNRPTISQAEVIAALQMAGHGPPPPGVLDD